MKKAILGVAILVLGVASTIGARTALYRPLEPGDGPAAAAVPALEPLAGDIDRFAAAIRYRTISHQDPAAFDHASFAAFRSHLEASFPRAHRALTRELVGGHGLLYTWPGTDPSLRPIVLLGHYDVVPVDSLTLDDWAHPPFDGVVADGYVWGRGAIDDKVNVLAALEAVETLLAMGRSPRRTIILAFGHDEEVGGREGAVRIADRLAAAGIDPELVLDEGGAITEGLLDGVARPVALVGVAEKGYAAVQLTVSAAGGHGSMPPPQTAAGVVAAAVARLEARPLPPRLGVVNRAMFDRVGREMPLGRRIALSNLWAFGPLLLGALEEDPSTNATIRTTTAVTMLEGSIKENVLPTRARAVVNFRILPGDSIAGVLEHVRRVVDDERVEIEVLGFASEPSPVAPTDGAAFERIAGAIRSVAPEALVTPYLVVGATDARHFTRLTDRVYRFAPVLMKREDMARFHGTNERLGIEDYRRVVRFYTLLMTGD